MVAMKRKEANAIRVELGKPLQKENVMRVLKYPGSMEKILSEKRVPKQLKYKIMYVENQSTIVRGE